MLMWPLGLGIAGAAFLADQLTKHLVLANAAAILPAVPIVPGLNLVLVRNTGVTFGCGDTARRELTQVPQHVRTQTGRHADRIFGQAC